MPDIVAELRDEKRCGCYADGAATVSRPCVSHHCVTCRAADEIERLRGLLADEQYIRMKADYSRGQKSWANMINEREAQR